MFTIMNQKLNKTNRMLTLVVALLMFLVYFLPLWFVNLSAPQYPETLGMYIYINDIRGRTPYDLQNINLLNHYIGMQEIAADSIPELQFMPYILAYMIAGAIVAFFINRIYMVVLGILNTILVGIAGLYDFWRWEYNYGHNLNPDAAIKVPGMSYQPPLIGCKELLNITACSWPHIGGILLLVVLGILFWIWYNEYKQKEI